MSDIDRAARGTLLPLFVALAASALLACSGTPVPTPEPWGVTALGVHAPAGSTEPGAQRCTLAGSACAPIAAGARLDGEQQLHVAQGARATFALGGESTLAIEGEARVSLRGGVTPELAIEHGLAELRCGAIDPGGRGYHLVVGGAHLTIDPAWPARLAVRALPDRPPTVVVEQGRATVLGGPEPLELGSGQAAILAPGKPPERRLGAAVGVDLGPRPDERGAPTSTAPRGLGSMSARVPGTSDIVSGVRLSSHKVHVVIHDGLARTEIEEVFQNDTPRVLEGRYLFPVPPDATVSRLALWVGDALVEGEIVERARAERIMKGIVDDSVRPRDPALLEWVRGSEVSLTVFPIPAKGSRKVLLAYDQVLDQGADTGEARYLYPLSLGADRAVKIDELAIDVTATDGAATLSAPRTPGYAATIKTDGGPIEVSFSARDFTPSADFIFTFTRSAGASPITAYRAPEDTRAKKGAATKADAAKGAAAKVDAGSEAGFVTMRIPIRWPDGVPAPARARHDRALILDVSQSQSIETLAGAADLAARILGDLDPDERFVLLACDSACASFPEDGLARPTEATLADAERWLHAREPGGSSDLAGALIAGAQRLDAGAAGQVIYLGDGVASAGELRAESIAARVKPELTTRAIELRLLGAGRSLDETILTGVARAVGASYERVSTGAPLAQRAAQLALGLRCPLLTGATLDVPATVTDVEPRVLPPLRVGQELLITGRAAPGAEGAITLTGSLDGAPFTASRAIAWAPAGTDERVAPRLWASARIADLEAGGDAAAGKEIIALSTRHHVMSQRTALLVLENDRMFAEFGIERTQASAGAGRAASPSGPFADRAGAIANELSRLDLAQIGTLGASDPRPRSSALDSSSMNDAPGAVGHLWGAGGLDLRGVGEGGGAQGFGAGHAQGFGGGGMQGGLLGPGEASAVRAPTPKIQMGAVNSSGRLPAEVITRILRRNFGRYRLCYENGLRRNPTLAGRVTVRLLILANGEVGSAADGGSSLADAGVIACIVRGVQGLNFPTPDGGSLTVTVPFVFAPEGGAPSPRITALRPTILPEGPSAVQQAGDEAWRSQGEDALDKLRRAVREGEQSRARHEALIRGLLTHGRFDEALVAARRFVELDPDLPRARELLGWAAAASGDGELARRALDAQVEAAPTSGELHLRAARAFEAAGDERRACAHFRSLVELRPIDDDARMQALRCRARLGEREVALREGQALEKPGPRVTQLLATLAQGAAPAWDGSRQNQGQLEATLRCADGVEDCPTVLLLTPSGAVISPWTPSSARTGATSTALADVPEGRYRTLLVGGSPDARGELTVRAFGGTRKFPVSHGGLQTIALSTVTSPRLGFGGSW